MVRFSSATSNPEVDLAARVQVEINGWWWCWEVGGKLPTGPSAPALQ